ncbi:MAG: hypothetical protein HUK15_04130, partial [Bacteroidales bacterium]|nr:hypothetical protein [Bacteroidales bacterium]
EFRAFVAGNLVKNSSVLRLQFSTDGSVCFYEADKDLEPETLVEMINESYEEFLASGIEVKDTEAAEPKKKTSDEVTIRQIRIENAENSNIKPSTQLKKIDANEQLPKKVSPSQPKLVQDNSQNTFKN